MTTGHACSLSRAQSSPPSPDPLKPPSLTPCVWASIPHPPLNSSFPIAAVAVEAVPTVLGAMGFTGAGIAASSIAAKMMSVAAVSNGGGVAAGSLVATLQSVGKCPRRGLLWGVRRRTRASKDPAQTLAPMTSRNFGSPPAFSLWKRGREERNPGLGCAGLRLTEPKEDLLSCLGISFPLPSLGLSLPPWRVRSLLPSHRTSCCWATGSCPVKAELLEAWQTEELAGWGLWAADPSLGPGVPDPRFCPAEPPSLPPSSAHAPLLLQEQPDFPCHPRSSWAQLGLPSCPEWWACNSFLSVPLQRRGRVWPCPPAPCSEGPVSR